jgi:hypothetical protein
MMVGGVKAVPVGSATKIVEGAPERVIGEVTPHLAAGRTLKVRVIILASPAGSGVIVLMSPIRP